MRYMLVVLSLVLLSAEQGVAGPDELPADPLLAFNERLLQFAEVEDGFLTLKGVRAAAMMHLAVHDALSAIEDRNEPYHYRASAPTADPLAAALQAAFVVATDQYPDRLDDFSALRARSLPAGENGDRIDRGLALGEDAARSILARRQGDGWDSDADYRWHPMAPGVYAEFDEHSGTPEGFVFGAGWAKAQPFALQEPDQFRAPPPPAIDSQDYTVAYNEVRQLGRFQSMQRTLGQTHIALWWKDFAENSHNRLARDLVSREQTGLLDAARLFALLNMAIFDAYVNIFDNKFHFNHWRPYTAIRWAANDGNADTVPEADWTNTHRHTYAFPSYPSAHGSACAAAQSAIADTFGHEFAFAMRIPKVDIAGPYPGKIAMHPPERQFESPWAAADECGLSRVFLGIHFRYDSVEGVRLGKRVGKYVVSEFLQTK